MHVFEKNYSTTSANPVRLPRPTTRLPRSTARLPRPTARTREARPRLSATSVACDTPIAARTPPLCALHRATHRDTQSHTMETIRTRTQMPTRRVTSQHDQIMCDRCKEDNEEVLCSYETGRCTRSDPSGKRGVTLCHFCEENTVHGQFIDQ